MNTITVVFRVVMDDTDEIKEYGYDVADMEAKILDALDSRYPVHSVTHTACDEDDDA